MLLVAKLTRCPDCGLLHFHDDACECRKRG